MYVYLEFVRKSFFERYVYRANSFIYLAGSIIRLMVMVSVWKVLLDSGISPEGVTFVDMMSYVIINMIVTTLISSNMTSRITAKIKTGDIAIDFIRPVSLKYSLISEQLGINLFRGIFNVIPVCLVALLFFNLKFPNSFLDVVMFTISIINGIILMFAINYILALCSFWLKTGKYNERYLRTLFELFGGTFIPLWFYPQFLYKLSYYLPFRLVTFDPISIYLGKLSLEASLKVITTQLIWIVCLYLLERYLWLKAQNYIFIQGG